MDKNNEQLQDKMDRYNDQLQEKMDTLVNISEKRLLNEDLDKMTDGLTTRIQRKAAGIKQSSPLSDQGNNSLEQGSDFVEDNIL